MAYYGITGKTASDELAIIKTGYITESDQYGVVNITESGAKVLSRVAPANAEDQFCIARKTTDKKQILATTPGVEGWQWEVTIPEGGGTFQYRLYGADPLNIDWGDNNSDVYTGNVIASHRYGVSGVYTITLYGTAERITAYRYQHLVTAILNKVQKIENLNSFYLTFENCSSLTSDKLPEGLFSNYTNASDFRGAFYACSGLTILPNDLFKDCTAATLWDGVFSACSGLTTLPNDLFKDCTAAISFGSTFYGCSGLTSIPGELFSNCSAVTNFDYCFPGCSSLTSIPSNLFSNCPLAISFISTFQDCTNLASIPISLFDDCTNVVSFAGAFFRCTNLTGNAPELWERDPEPNGGSCFYNCTGLSNYDDIPNQWK